MKNVIIYTKPSCGYCVKAKELFQKMGVQYQEKVLGVNGITKNDLQVVVDRVNPSFGAVSTVPQIFIDGTHVAGYDALVKLTNS